MFDAAVINMSKVGPVKRRVEAVLSSTKHSVGVMFRERSSQKMRSVFIATSLSMSRLKSPLSGRNASMTSLLRPKPPARDL